MFPANLLDIVGDFLFDPTIGKKKNEVQAEHARMMKVDVKDHDDHYDVEIDLPGFTKDQITVELNDGYLTVNAAKTVEKEETDNYVRKERFTGSMIRSFYVGDNLKQEDIHAKYENGVLSLVVPKADQKKLEDKKYITIE